MANISTIRPVPTSGVIVPMITPMLPDGSVDTESISSLCGYLIEAGVDGLLVLGSSGENAALDAAGRRAAVSAAVTAGGDRTHVMVGVPALGTADAVSDAREYATLGAHSLLVSAPFGFELSEAELADHFHGVANAAAVPVVAYEIPSRVKVSLSTSLITGLAADGVLAGVKDSSGNLGAARMRSEAIRQSTPLPHFTGSEECIDAFLLGGGSGSIPGLANVFPELHVAIAGHAGRGDWAAASAVQGTICCLLHLYFHPLPGGSFSAQIFALVKEALAQRGVIAHNTTAAPFRQADASIAEHVTSVLRRAASLVP